jgi:hypothetical protein
VPPSRQRERANARLLHQTGWRPRLIISVGRGAIHAAQPAGGLRLLRMRWSWEHTPHGVLKLLTPLVTGAGRRKEETIWASLKQFLEAHEMPQSQTQATFLACSMD